MRVVTRNSPGAGPFDSREDLDVARSVRVGPPPVSNLLLNGRALAEARAFRPELVMSGHIVTSPAAWMIGRAAHVPFVQYLHADEVRHRPRLVSFAVRRAAATIAVSDYTGGLAVSAGASPDRVHTIPNGVDLPPASGEADADRPTIVTVARLEESYKGHDVLIRALPLIRAQVPDVRWLVVGDGPLRPRLERAVASAGLGGTVSFLGQVPDGERDEALARAHVFALPNRPPPGGVGGEGFGIALLEASAHGLPVVAGRSGGTPDAVVHGQTGLLVDAADPRAVAGAITELLSDPPRARALGQAGRERARRFAWPLVVERLEELLLEVASERAAR